MASKTVIFFQEPGKSFNSTAASGGWNWEKGVLNDGAYFVTDENNSKGDALGGYEQGTSWGPAKKGDMTAVKKYFGKDANKYEVEGKKISEYTSPKELQQALKKAGYDLDDDNYAGSETMNTLLNYLRGDDTGKGTYLASRPRSSKKLSKRISKKTTSKPTTSSVDVSTIQFTKPENVEFEVKPAPDDEGFAQELLESMMQRRPMRKQGGTLKRTIAHKFQTGGHFLDKDKGIWEYEDPEMQKKIMQGYKNNNWTNEVKAYLKAHQDLKTYLDNAYKTLSPKLQYFTPDQKAQNTYNGQWAKISDASGTTGHFAEKMKAAGYEYDKATGTYRGQDGKRVFGIDSKGNLYREDAEGTGIIYPKLNFDSNNNSITFYSDSTNPANHGYKAAKETALASEASKNWAVIGKQLGLEGNFYNTMLAKKFKYDSNSGEYTKGGTRYQVKNGKVRAIDKGKNYSYSISTDALKQLLGI